MTASSRSRSFLVGISLLALLLHPWPMTGADAAPQSDYQPVAPTRVADTRSDDGALGVPAPISPGEARSFRVVGVAGVPSTGVAAVMVNLTAINATGDTFLTLYPSDAERPLASSVNPRRGGVSTSELLVRPGADGQVKVYNHRGSIDVILDVVGWSPTGSEYHAMVPARIFDSRSPSAAGATSGAINAGETRRVPVAGVGSIPRTGVEAVVLNLTVRDATAATFVSVTPETTSRPGTSTLNPQPGQVLTNEVIAKVAADGSIGIYNHAGNVEAVVDIVGWFSQNSSYTSLSPERIMCSRTGVGTTKARLGPRSSRQLTALGVGGVPAEGVGAVVLNVTALNASEPSFLTVYAGDMRRPAASTMNPRPGLITSNEIVAGVSSDGTVRIYNHNGSVDVLVDVVGWLPGNAALPPAPTLDPRTQLEIALFDRHNQARQDPGAFGGAGGQSQAPFRWSEDLAVTARNWSAQMAATGSFRHNPALSSSVCCWTLVGENVARFGPVGSMTADSQASLLMRSWMASDGHRRNILDPRFTQVGIGTAYDRDGKVYATVVFRRPTADAPRGSATHPAAG